MLHESGGKLSIAALRTALKGKSNMSERDFNEIVIGKLKSALLIRIAGDDLMITREGQRFLNIDPDPVTDAGIPAAPRVGGGFRALRSRSPMVLRAGALDYRDIPSLMGGVAVPYKTSARQESE
jgi:hypothetical protein